MKFDPLFVQLLRFFWRSFAVNRAVLGLAIVNLARFLRKSGADLVRILGDVVAQFFELVPQLALRGRHHGDRRLCWV